MLRPEQISLAQVQDRDAAAAASGAEGSFGEVMEIEFGGSVCTLAIRLCNDPASLRSGPEGGAESNMRLLLRRLSHDVPPLGAIVRIAVAGEAHVFAEPD